MTTRNSYWPDGYFPANYFHPDYWAGEVEAPGPGGGERVHWGRLDVIRPRRQPDVISHYEEPKRKRARRKKA